METLCRKGLAVLGCVALFAGCATAHKVGSARAALGQAKTAGAETKAPADYYMAEAYLERADHETREGDTKQARYFAEQSGKYSSQAIQKSGGGVK